MKIKSGFILKTIAGNTVAVPMGENLVNLQLMLTLNETGKFLWSILEQDCTEDELVAAMTKEYDIDEETARGDIREFVALLKENQILDEA
ncbi:MAG: PqqD family protein [Ruminococcaceae bacterium]|nr:PqqD family protein [Oscillospiraceae bacterium]